MSLNQTKQIEEYSYINFPMHDIIKKNVINYISRNLYKTIFEFEGNLFDIKSLNRLVNLDCLNCHSAHSRLCCEGSPYPPLKEDIEKITPLVSNILKIESQETEYRDKKLLFDSGEWLNSDGSFTSNCNKCFFFMNIESSDLHVCAIHKFSLQNGIDYTLLKPRGCLMYPLDCIDFSDGTKFVFSLDSDNAIEAIEEPSGCVNAVPDFKGFSRWSSYDLQFFCLNKMEREYVYYQEKTNTRFGKSCLPKHLFKLEEYKPVYKEEQKVLIRLFGEECISFIEKKSKELNYN